MSPVIQTAGQLEALEDPRPFHWSGPLGHGSIRAYTGRAQSYAQIIRSQPNVRTVISFLSRNVAQLGVHLFERLSDTDRERVTDHPFAAALRQPNPADRRLTTYRLMHRTVWDTAAFDVAFWGLLEAPPLERPVIVPLSPARVEVVGSLWPTEFIYHGQTGRRRSFRPDQIVYFQGSHNLDDPLWGIPPIEALRRIIAEDMAAGEYREQFWGRGARFDMVLKRPSTAPKWSDPARDRFTADWRAAWSGQGPEAGGTPLLEDDMDVEKVEGPDARSSQYVEARKLSREEAAALWHVDPIWVGIASQGLSFSSVKERHKALYQDTLGPWVVMLEQDLTHQALPAFEADPERLERLYSKLNIAEKLRGSVEDLAESIFKLTGRPILSANEGRALIERNDHPAGDGLAMPLAITIVSDEEDTEPSPTPEEPTEPAEPAPLIPAASKRRGTKAGPSVAQHRAIEAEHREAHRLALARTFTRQLREVLSAYGAAEVPGIDDVWDAERWDTELHGDLFGLALDLAAAYGETVADALGFDGLDETRWVAYLDENARIAAETINTVSRTGVAAALETLDDDEDDELEPAEVFGSVLAESRAEQSAQSRYTQVAAFAGAEVATQAGRSQKVWVVTSSNSRHAALDGEAVPLGGIFSNGMDYPGDPTAPVEETAGCLCMLVFE